MTAEIVVPNRHGWERGQATPTHSGRGKLRALVIASGLCCSVLFVVIGLWNELQMFGDGSFFSYSVAVQDAWTFWQNLSGRLFVYLFAYVPSQTYVGLTRDAHGGVAVYGFLFFVAPLLGLAATFWLDGTKGQILFSYASASTACLCPLVFGFPTETWMSHSLFWPAIALCHHDRAGAAKLACVFAILLALVFTHEGALIFAFAIFVTLLMRGKHDPAYLRARGVFILVMLIWIAVKTLLPPDDIMADVLKRGALRVFDPNILTGYLVLLLFSVAFLYAAASVLFWRSRLKGPHLYAALLIAVLLSVYWTWFDHALHAENRYYLRTVILLVTPTLGAIAVMHAFRAEGRLLLPLPFLPRLMAYLTSAASERALTGAFALLLLVHAVETTKFVKAWGEYRGALRELAIGNASDPALGDSNFVSSYRIDAGLNRLAWVSTTPFLSVLVTPDLAPSRLVIYPYPGFLWLSCETAASDVQESRALPVESLRLIKTYSCLHR